MSEIGRGGARTGAGRKPKAIADKIAEGNPGRREITKLNNEVPAKGKNKPSKGKSPATFLTLKTRSQKSNTAVAVFKEVYSWLAERQCENLVKKELVEQYSLDFARYVQCEESIHELGLLAKHPTTGNPIASPYVSMGLTYQKQANSLWQQIWQIVKENSDTLSADDDSMMERMLSGSGTMEFKF